MIVILKQNTMEEEKYKLIQKIKSFGVGTYEFEDENNSTICLLGYVEKIKDILSTDKNIENIIKISEPFKLSNRKFHKTDSVYNIEGNIVGGKKITLIAGPCSVESKEQILEVAKGVKEIGAGFLRGGAFKPRTSPYSFQGMGLDGLELLKLAKKETGLPIVTEVMSVDMIDKFLEDVDIIQVGARNMQNFPLLKELGKTNKPILLKRGLSATIEEFLMSAEYIMSEGNEKVILCERGIRTFENFTRNTLDLSAIPVIKKLSHLPIIVDPSHATGKSWLIDSLSKGAVAVGADGLIIEVHNDPKNAICDGEQSIEPKQFKELVDDLKLFAKAGKREI